MMFFSPKRIVCASAALLLLLLSACNFTLPSLPQIGGVKGLPTATPENSATVTGGVDTEEASPTAPEVDIPAGADQPSGAETITSDVFNDPENPPHGLILFSSTSEQPFRNAAETSINNASAQRYLWAISTDGVRAGRVSPEGRGSALHAPQAEGKQSKVLANGFQLPAEQFEAVALPEECTETGGASCGGFQFSPDGRMLSYFSGSGSCGRTLTLYETTEQKQVNRWENAHWAYFFQNGSLIFAVGDCDSQMAYLYTPGTGKQGGVAKTGTAYWNPQRTAVIFQVRGEPALQSLLWGFSLETSKVFLWPSQEMVIEDTPIWLADGEYFVFQHQSFKYDKSTKTAAVNSPRQIVLMNAKTRSQKQLAFDTRSSYHLCGAADLPDSSAVGSPCDQNYGSWLHIQRLPYQPLRFPVAETNKTEVECALYGLGCEEKPEILALDWKSGKEYPWDEAHVPEATATPGANKPDLDAVPFYEDPAGEFAFFVGRSGKTLWYIPRDREPALWVQDGENFVYLP